MRTIDSSRARQFNQMIGRYLKRNRISADLSPCQVILATGISSFELRDYENGAKSMPAFLFVRLLELYRTDWVEANATLHRASKFLKVH
jgi:hypothetical protein